MGPCIRSSAGSLVLLCDWEVTTLQVMIVLLLWGYATTVSVDMRRFSATNIIAVVRNPSLLLGWVPFTYQLNKVKMGLA